MKNFLEGFTIATSIFLIIAGYSKSEKFTASIYLKKKLLLVGIVLLAIIIIANIPDIYQGFVTGWKDAAK